MTQCPLSHTIACVDRDFHEWHGGVPHAALWGLDVDVDAVRRRVEQSRAALADLLLPRYEREPHITLAFLGLWPRGRRVPDADLAALARLNLAPFDVVVRGLATFSMGPYLRVECPTAHRLAAALRRHNLEEYVPHVTVGNYAVSLPLDAVSARLTPADPLSIPITRISLLRYETHDICGPLTTLGHFDLITQTWHASDDTPDTPQ